MQGQLSTSEFENVMFHCQNTNLAQIALWMVVVLSSLAHQESFSQERPLSRRPESPRPAEAEIDSDEKKNDSQEPVIIPDTPRHIDPATLVFKPLAKNVTVDFRETSIREVVTWIQDETSITVLVDEASLSDDDILPSDPVSIRLANQPLYLLLDRMASIGLGWYVEDEILHIVTAAAAADHLTTVSINIGTFFDQGFESDVLLGTIESGTGDGWLDSSQGDGTLVLLGDVLFVRQTGEMHRRVDGMLKAMQTHGRQTFVDDPTEHLKIRQNLDSMTSVNFRETPLAEVLTELSTQSGIEIRRDAAAFRKLRIREREPVSLKLANQKLTTVLDSIVAKLRMTWTLRNGSILITSQKTAAALFKTAIYDVRDLCRDDDESVALTDAIMIQTAPDSWLETGAGDGIIVFPKPGIMVIRQTERTHSDILIQLSAYRKALKSSKVRKKKDKNKESLTVYYKMPTPIAVELEIVIKKMVAPESWKDNQHPEWLGTVTRISSRPSILDPKSTTRTTLIENSVLVILQTRENHELIRDVISNIEHGNENSILGNSILGGGGQGGGGFGGGVFSAQENKHPRK